MRQALLGFGIVIAITGSSCRIRLEMPAYSQPQNEPEKKASSDLPQNSNPPQSPNQPETPPAMDKPNLPVTTSTPMDTAIPTAMRIKMRKNGLCFQANTSGLALAACQNGNAQQIFEVSLLNGAVGLSGFPLYQLKNRGTGKCINGSKALAAKPPESVGLTEFDAALLADCNSAETGQRIIIHPQGELIASQPAGFCFVAQTVQAGGRVGNTKCLSGHWYDDYANNQFQLLDFEAVL